MESNSVNRLSPMRDDMVIAKMFLSAAVAMIFTQMAGVVAGIIDGVVTSRFLGSEAYSSVSLFGPLISIIMLFASFVSTGGQIIASQRIGAGERKEANAVFAASILGGVVIALFFILMSLFAPASLFRICGVSLDKRPELYGHMLDYLHGYMFGIPAAVMVQVMSPFLIIDKGKKLVSFSALVLCVTDILGDLLNVFLFHGGVFGMGLATAVSIWIQIAVLMTHFLSGHNSIIFTFSAFRRSHLIDIAKSGSVAFVKKIATILRDICTNRINLFVAVSTAAVAAKGMQGDLNQLMFCIGVGIGRTLVSMSSMYYGANDRQGLKKLFTCAMKTCIRLGGIFGLLVFLGAPFLARIYTNDPDVIRLAVLSIRCMAVSLVVDNLSVAYQDYLQGIGNRKLLSFMCFAERLVIPVIVAVVLGLGFGSVGVMVSLAVGKYLMAVVMLVVFCVLLKHFPRSIDEIMLLPADFGGKDADNLYAEIRTMEDVIRESERTRLFCEAHQVDRDHARLMALFLEEMAANIVDHGGSRNREGVCVDFRLSVQDGSICLSLRDFCKEFDPLRYYEDHDGDDLMRGMGIRIVIRSAKDVRYFNSFNSNSLLIYMDGTGNPVQEAAA